MRVKSNISRRELLAGAISAPMLAGAQSQPARPKIAAITTTYFKYSHTQHIVDRFLEGYGWNGTHHILRWTWCPSTSIKSVTVI